MPFWASEYSTQKPYVYFTLFRQSHKRIAPTQKPQLPLTQKLELGYVFPRVTLINQMPRS